MYRCIVFFLFLLFTSCGSDDSIEIKGRVLSHDNNLKVIKVWGTHYERGFAQGFLLGEQIKSIYEGYIKTFMGDYLEYAKDLIKEGLVFKIDSVFHEEAKGVIDGIEYANVFIDDFNYHHLLLSNAFLDVMGLSHFIELRNMRKSMGCSVLMSWGDATKDTDLNGGTIVTRHLDWPVHDDVVNNQVMVIHLPEEKNKQPWVMIGFAGQISVLSAINESRYAVFLNMMNDFHTDDFPNRDIPYEPLCFTLRKAIENRDMNGDGIYNMMDIKEAVSANNNGYAEGFIVSALGPAYNEEPGFIAELAPVFPYIVYRTIDSNDRMPGNNIYTANSSIKRMPELADYCSRYSMVEAAMGNGLFMDADKSWDIMKNNSAIKNNIQFMQYIPSKNILLLSVYNENRAAYINKPRSFNLDGFWVLN